MDTPPVPPARFAHLSFRVADLERSIAFYTRHLGCTEGPAFVDDQGRRTGIYLACPGGAFLELFQHDEVETGNGHFCFEVDDIETTHAALVAAGVEVEPPFIGRSGAKICFIHDPDGHSIEFNDYSDPECWIATWRREHGA